MTVEKVYVITVEKLDNGLEVFFIDNVKTPKLYLKRNVFYAFHNLSDEPFYFTNDPEGGFKRHSNGRIEEAPGSVSTNVPGGFKGLAKGTIYFKTTEDLPIQFYYQSGKHKNMGEQVFLV